MFFVRMFSMDFYGVAILFKEVFGRDYSRFMLVTFYEL